MKLIIERDATFKSNSDIEVKVTQKKSSQTFVKDTKWSKICSTVKSTWQAKHSGESPLDKSVHAYDMCAKFLTCE